MLVVRKEQMSVFSQYMVRRFENSTMAYLLATYPQHARKKGGANLLTLIHSGIEKAAEYDIKAEDEVRCFIECMIIFGPDFDNNSASEWAGEILSDTSIAADEKTRRLRKCLKHRLEVQ